MKLPKMNWIPFDKENPPVDIHEEGNYLILIREESLDDECNKCWLYSVKAAISHGFYNYEFWDIINSSVEDRDLEVIAYSELPYGVAEKDLLD